MWLSHKVGSLAGFIDVGQACPRRMSGSWWSAMTTLEATPSWGERGDVILVMLPGASLGQMILGVMSLSPEAGCYSQRHL